MSHDEVDPDEGRTEDPRPDESEDGDEIELLDDDGIPWL